jgi:nucleotide-binding universal stress UspA family protein
MTTPTPTKPNRIVVGVDGSEPSKEALRWAARIAKAEGAHIDAIAAWEFPTSLGWTVLPTDYSPKLDIEKSLTETVDEVFGENRPADMVLRSFEGSAAKVLLTAGKGALMIVVGSRGHGGFMGLLLGSVSAKVAEHATCPVLVVHAATEEVGS